MPGSSLPSRNSMRLRGAAAGGDMVEVIGETVTVQGGHRVAAAGYRKGLLQRGLPRRRLRRECRKRMAPSRKRPWGRSRR